MILETLPAKLDAERAILGAVILDNGVSDQALYEMESADFASRSHRLIFAAMRWLDQNKRAITPITLAAALEQAGKLEEIGGPAYIAELFDGAIWLKDLASHRAVVQDTALARKLAYIGDWVGKEAMARDCDPRALLKALEEKIQGLVEAQPSDDLISSTAGVDRLMEELRENWASGREIIGLRTGFAALDQALGGIRNGRYYVIASPPGMGKTTLAYQWALNFLNPEIQDDSVKRAGLAISLEMSTKELLLRALAGETGIDAHRIETGQLDADSLDRVELAAERLRGLSLEYLEGFHRVTGRSIESRVGKVKRKYGAIHFLVLDYVQLVDGEKEGETANARITEVSRRLKRVAHRFQIPVIVLSQMNREHSKRAGSARDGQIPDLRDSGSIAQDADVVGFINPVDHGNPHSDRRRITIEKQRAGPSGLDFEIVLRRETSRFEMVERSCNRNKPAWGREWREEHEEPADNR